MTNTLSGVRKFAITLLLSLGLSQVSAAVVLNVQGGVLMGATGVSVMGNDYDVSFTDGSCSSLFSNCTSFALTSQTMADAAAQALLDQVFIDSVLGQFDSVTSLIAGCTATNVCEVLSAFTSNSSNFVGSRAKNLSGTGTDSITGFLQGKNYDTGLFVYQTFAVWTPSASVPEPGTLALAGIAVLLLARSRRKGCQLETSGAR